MVRPAHILDSLANADRLEPNFQTSGYTTSAAEIEPTRETKQKQPTSLLAFLRGNGRLKDDAGERVVMADAQIEADGLDPRPREFFQSVPTPEWFGDWLGVGGGRVSVNADGLFRKYQKQAETGSAPRFESPEAVAAFVQETLDNAHIAIEASRDQAVMVARIGEREQAVVVEDKGERGGVVISAFVPTAGQLDKKIADVMEAARRQDATPAILVSPLAAADADTRLLVSRWLPLPLDRVQPGKYDLTTGKFLGNRTLFQSRGKAPKGTTNKGAITFVPGRRPLIRLFENADLSTVLHETGHLFLEMLGDLAAAEDAPQALKSDYAAVLRWLNVEDRSQIGVEQHEQLARGFEAWLMEGKAPSLELRTVFQRFRSWLSLIYRSVKRLNVELTDDVRQVFDRMVATDDAIAGAEAAMKFEPLLKDAVDGITDGERRAALDQAERATLYATREVEEQQRQALERERRVRRDAGGGGSRTRATANRSAHLAGGVHAAISNFRDF